MIYQLKFKHSAEQRVFWYSDLHYRHNPNWPIPIWKDRGYNSAFECDAAQIENWNKKITNNDIVFLLGDSIVGAGKDGGPVLKNLLDVLNFKEIYLQMGNHGSGWKQLFDENYENGVDKYWRISISIGSKVVHLIPNYYEIYVNGQSFVLSHYAILSWNSMNKNSVHLFGHSHNNLSKTDWVKENYLTAKCLDVGPESIKEPISFDEVMEIMKDRKTLLIDHHNGDSSSPL